MTPLTINAAFLAFDIFADDIINFAS